jgi:hypothetical protein
LVPFLRWFLHDPSFGFLDKTNDLISILPRRELLSDLFDGLGRIQVGIENDPEHILQGLDPLAGKSLSSQSNGIQPIKKRRACSGYSAEGKHILGDNRIPTDESILPYPAELVDTAESTDCGKIIHIDVTAESCPMQKNGLVSNDTIMGNVRIGHEVVIMADNRLFSASDSAPVYGHEFPEYVIVPDLHARLFPFVRDVLGFGPDGRKRGKPTIPSDLCFPVNADVSIDFRAFVKGDLFPDYRVGADI